MLEPSSVLYFFVAVYTAGLLLPYVIPTCADADSDLGFPSG
jgi:hypothetical protein